jgi:DNA-binding NarL/FixJ family response regulator
MSYPRCFISSLTRALLDGFCIDNPTAKQQAAAEALVVEVILTTEAALSGNLSPKEQVCLEMAACGFSAEETAKKLSLSTGTIKNYRERIREKLSCKTIAQAVYQVFCRR